MKSYKQLLPTAFLACFSFHIPFQAQGALNFEDVLPQETVALMTVNDLSKIYEAIDNEDSPLSFWKEETIQKFFAPFIEHVEEWAENDTMLNDLGLKLEDFKTLLPGRISIALSDLNVDLAEGDNDMYITFLADYGGDPETFEKLMTYGTDKDDEDGVEKEDYEGTTLYIEKLAGDSSDDELIPIAAGLVNNDIIVGGYPVEHVKATISRFKADKVSSGLAESATFKKVQDRTDSPDSLLYLNLQPLAEIGKKAVTQFEKKSKPNLFFSPTALFDALGFDALEVFYIGKKFTDKQVSANTGILFNDRRGITRLLNAYSDNPIDYPSFIPSDSFSCSVNRFDFGILYREIETMVTRISPLLSGLYQGYLNQLKNNTGIDLHTDIIDNLGDEFIQFSGYGPDIPSGKEQNLEDLSYFYALAVKNPSTMETALKTIKNNFGINENTVAKRDYLGTTIYTFKDGQSESGRFSYAFTKDHIFAVLGSPSVLESALSRVDKKNKSLWDNTAIQKALEDDSFQNGEVAISYSDVGILLNTVFSTIINQGVTDDNGKPIYDPEALPGIDAFPLFIVTKTYLEATGLFNKAILFKKSDAE